MNGIFQKVFKKEKCLNSGIFELLSFFKYVSCLVEHRTYLILYSSKSYDAALVDIINKKLCQKIALSIYKPILINILMTLKLP